MSTGIKRIDWFMGQMLLPHHLVAQEESLWGSVGHLLKQFGIPFYGLSRIKWDKELYTQGILSFSELTLILPSGQLIDFPGNAVVAPFDLNSTGKSEVILYLHVIEQKKQKEEEFKLLEETAKITFGLYQLILSTQKSLEHSKSVFKLAQFEKSVESEWRLSYQYIPPLINTIADPFLTEIFTNILRVLEGVKKKLVREMDNPELFAFQNSEWRLCLLEISRIQRLCANNLNGQIALHPYFLYEKLCELLDSSSKTESNIPNYDHENLADLFDQLMHKIEHLFINEQKDFSFLEFERRSASYYIDTLPPTLSKAKEVYLIIQKPDSKTYFNANNMQFTSKLRLSHVRHFAISGITLTPIKKPAFLSSSFADEIEAFAIDQKDEWKKAAAEGNLVLLHQDITPDFHLFLYWKNIDGTAQ